MTHIICKPSDVSSGMCGAHAHAWCMCLCRNSASKYLSGPACLQADLNLVKITASHFWVLNTQNAN